MYIAKNGSCGGCGSCAGEYFYTLRYCTSRLSLSRLHPKTTNAVRPKQSFHWFLSGVTSGCGFYPITSIGTSSNVTGPTLTGSIPRPSQTGNQYHGNFSNSTSGVQKTYLVDVGAYGDLVFNPAQVDAAIGDVIEFNFLALNHTLTQSELYDPCSRNGQFDTGFNQFNPQNETGKFIVRFQVKIDEPQRFFCSQTIKSSHCHAGMVFGLNTAGQMDQFVKNATALRATQIPTSFETSKPVLVGNFTNSTVTRISHASILAAVHMRVLYGAFLVCLAALL